MIAHEGLTNALTALGEPLLAPRDALLFDVGEPCTGAYLITAGTVDVELLTPDGILVWSCALNAGGILGLPAAISQRQHHVRATVTAESRMVFLATDKIRLLIQTDPRLGLMIIEVICEELIALHRKLSSLNHNATPPDMGGLGPECS